MEKVILDATNLRAFGEQSNKNFFLVTDKKYENNFNIIQGDYSFCSIIALDRGESFLEKLVKIPESSHVLTILTESLVHSVPPEVLGKRKLMIMACRSGKTELDGIAHFIDCAKNQNIEKQQQKANRFFEQGETSNYLLLKDYLHNTTCHFNHLHDDYDWHEQAGYIDWGEQQVFPSGEVACFLVPLYTDQLPQRQFDLNGEMVIKGPLIVQSGPPSFQIKDQIEIHKKLSLNENYGIVLKIEEGVIISHSVIHENSKPAEKMLADLFRVDSRYRHIYEVGFSINDSIIPWPGNTAMNEVWGENGGKIHLGIGMLPYTQYHIDLFCKSTRVIDDKENVIFGKTQIMREKASSCPCTVA